jgi:outer membrane protein TolC
MKHWAVAGLLFWAGAALPQERLTPETAVTITLENNRTLRGAQQDLEAAQWGKTGAIAGFLPKVSVASSLTRMDGETVARANSAVDFIRTAAPSLGIPPSALADLRPFAYRDTYGTSLSVVQPIYNGGLEIAGLRAANAGEDAKEFLYRDTEQDVIARVRISYLSVLKAQELVELARESAERTKRYLEMTRRRADVGMRTSTDVLRWEVQLGSDEGNVIQAENGHALARLQLNETMGVDLQNTYELAPVDSTASFVTPAGSPMLASLGGEAGTLTAVPESHPALQMMQANMRLADAGVEAAWSGFKPRVNLAFQYGWEQNNTLKLDGIRPWALALSVSFPVFNGFGDYAALQKARAEYRRTEVQAETFRRGLTLQATSSRLTLAAARQRLEVARKAEKEAQDVLASVSRRYEQGGASNVDLIDVQTAYTAARTSAITAMYDTFIAEIEMARALGTITNPVQ